MNSPENQTRLSVLIIDDEAQIQRLLTVALEANGYVVSAVGEGREGIAKAAQRRYDAIILDLGLPDMNGLEVLKNLREWTQIPVIVLTVQDGETEKVESLDRGADDYVTKPFNTSELLARLRATVRRANRSEVAEPIYRFGDVEVNLASRHVLRKGEQLRLTATEYALLRLFVQHAGKVLTHQQILRQIWGPEHESQTQYLRVYILRLREKLEANPAEPVLIATEPGVGYRLVEAVAS
ncbi:MAG TPA: response regulator transcription factor [Verrucomicrobiae bacterium]|nr:response regulator transcription factor [Verrucomicrobiae bacterium]